MTKIQKYNYIDILVENLNNVKLHEFVQNDLDLKTWLSFLMAYIYSCKILLKNNEELTKENISNTMKKNFEKDHNIKFLEMVQNVKLSNSNLIEN